MDGFYAISRHDLKLKSKSEQQFGKKPTTFVEIPPPPGTRGHSLVFFCFFSGCFLIAFGFFERFCEDQKPKSPSSKMIPSSQFPPPLCVLMCQFVFRSVTDVQQGLKRPHPPFGQTRGEWKSLPTSKLHFQTFCGNFALPFFLKLVPPGDGEIFILRRTAEGEDFPEPYLAMDMLWLHPRHWNGRLGADSAGVFFLFGVGQKRRGNKKRRKKR